MPACYCCDPANPDRITVYDPVGATMRFPSRFEGPPGTVNGGMAVGALTCPALEAAVRAGIDHPAATRVTARLHRGIPHTKDLAASVEEDAAFAVSLRDGDEILIAGTVEIASFAQPARPGDELAPIPHELDALAREMASVREPSSPPFFEETRDHPIAGCFSCGPKNVRGLHVFPRFAGDGVTWASWSPEASFVDAGGGLAASVIASALDCSSGICLPREQQEELLRNDQFYLLGSLDVRYLRVPSPDAGYHVVARARERDGRKFYGASALFDTAGVPFATAEAIWIIVTMTRTQAFGAR